MTAVRKYFLRVEKGESLKATVVNDLGEIIKEASAPASKMTESEIKASVLSASGLIESDIS